MRIMQRHCLITALSIEWLSILFCSYASGFDVVRIRASLPPRSKLYAKPPPTSKFDLEAIEAFEAKVELKALGLGNDEDDGDDLMVDEAFHDDSSTVSEFVVPERLHNKRIDAVISDLIPQLSRSVCGNLIVDGQVQDEARTVLNRKSYKVVAGTTLRVTIPQEEKPTEIKPQDLPLNILYEDEHMIVLNKQAGMVVHPAAGNWDGTVVNALAFYLSSSPFGSGDFVGEESISSNAGEDPTGADGETQSFRPGIVHRLDKGTTGVLVVAKTSSALASLSNAFAARTTKKTYLAITVGNPGRRVSIDKPIGRHPIHRQRMRVVPDPHRKDSSGTSPKDRLSPTMLQKGRRALSFVDTLAFDSKLSLVQVRIETGRTHQIRVHLQDRQTPIYGDDVYGISDWNQRLLKTYGIERPLLHAYCLEVDHPVTGERMTFKAPMPDDMKRLATNIWPTGPDEAPELFS